MLQLDANGEWLRSVPRDWHCLLLKPCTRLLLRSASFLALVQSDEVPSLGKVERVQSWIILTLGGESFLVPALT